jgi:hypothetical protein
VPLGAETALAELAQLAEGCASLIDRAQVQIE